ncbi:MAG: glucose-1-phosphate thymidylyltransferase [Elusimicrobia bacterium]|nr:glucose-1-phosphate thymidylyltransferase [Candidatus Obscuribacterium magneticum]
MLKAEDFFELSGNPLKILFDHTTFVWEALKNIDKHLKEHMKPNVSELRKHGCFINKTFVLYNNDVIESGCDIELGDATKGKLIVKRAGQILAGASVIYEGVALMDNRIQIGTGSVIEPGALLKGPCMIGNNTEIRQGAYIRGNVIIGDRCVVGHTTEMKSAIMLGESKAGHFAYIGDSILGKVNLGAGTKLANLKIIESPVVLFIDGKRYETGLRKFGAILADGVETGCNSATTPGTLLGKDVLLYPNATARGYCPPKKIIKLKQVQEIIERK